jgi:hypothetical protein
MKVLATALMLHLTAGFILAQSLAELAEREKERRRKVKEQSSEQQPSRYDEHSLHRVHHGLSATPSATATAPESQAPVKKPVDAETLAGLQQAQKPHPPIVLASLVDEAMPETEKDVSFQRSRGGDLPMNPGTKDITSTGNLFRLPLRGGSDVLFDGAIYTDWFRSAYNDGLSTSQLSTRVKLDAGKRPGYGMRFFLDARHRYSGDSSARNKLLLYDARLIYDNIDKPLTLSLGQMNLYDSAGVGQLAGGVLGVRLNPAWTVGGYGGLEPDIYSLSYDLAYTKFGAFTQYRGSNAKSVALSYNTLMFQGAVERSFLYGSGLMPIGDLAVVYGSAEYELGNGVQFQDRLSHLFLNARYTFSRAADVTGYYSSGRGLDYHRFLIEQSQTPDRNSAELERFYYTESYGVRLSVKPYDSARFFVAQRESEQKDQGIRNHTTQLGASAWNIAGSGIGLYGSYDINRGDASESNSYRISVSREFGPLSWTGYYSSTFNGIRFDAVTGRPEIVRLVDHRTISNDFFFDITDAFALSLEHDLSRRGEEDENTLFFRLMFRF